MRETLRLLNVGWMVVGFFTIGCTYVNKPLNSNDTPVGQIKPNQTTAGLVPPAENRSRAAQERWFVGLAISGGGSRSANFSAAVMFELQRLGLLGRLDAISAVSGGALSASYYCLASDAEWNPGNVQRKLSHPFASDMWWRMVQPWILGAMLFSDYDRSDILAGALNDALLSKGGRSLTYGDLRADRPRLLLNATDLQSGKRFVFCNESFDEINSDLARYPIAYAAAASSSVPVVFHHVTLRDFSTTFNQYRHFVDGGVVDNTGVQSLLEAYTRSNANAEKRNQPPPYGKGAVLILIDAGTLFNAKLSDKGDVGFIESLGTAAKLGSGALLQRASSATMVDLIVQHSPATATADDIRKQMKQLEQTGLLRMMDKDARPMVIVHIALSRAASLKSAPFQSFAQSLDAIPTYFNISDFDAHSLYQAAKLIVQEKFEEELEKVGREVGK